MTSDETRGALLKILQSAARSDDLAMAIEQHVLPSAAVHLPNGDIRYGEGATAFLAEGYEAFPDLTLTFEEMMVTDDRAAVQFVLEGTHTGPFRGFAPTGRAVRLPLCVVVRIEAGLIAEMWYYGNLYAPLVGTLGPLPG